MKIIKREVEDDLEAFHMARCIEQAGGSVFSITFNGRARHPSAMADHSRFIVWGKFEADDLPDTVDKLFDNWLESRLTAFGARSGHRTSIR